MADAAAIRAAAQQAAAERIEAAALSPLDDATAAKTVWVGHIPDGSASEFELRRRFGVHGSVVSVGLRPKPGTGKTWALVTFDSVDGAQRAVATPTMAQDGAGGEKLQLKVRPADVGRELTSAHSSSDGHALADVAARQQTNVEADGDSADDSPYQRGQRARFWLPSSLLPADSEVSAAMPEWANRSAVGGVSVRGGPRL